MPTWRTCGLILRPRGAISLGQSTFLVQILVALAAQLLLPAYFIATLWWRRHGPSGRWLLTAAYTAAYLAYLFVAGRWDIVGYYWRYILPVIGAPDTVRHQPQRSGMG